MVKSGRCIASSHASWLVITPHLSTQNTLAPAFRSFCDTKRLSPSTNDSTAITEATPMMVPSSVRNDRILLARIAPSAIPELSLRFTGLSPHAAPRAAGRAISGVRPVVGGRRRTVAALGVALDLAVAHAHDAPGVAGDVGL